MKRDCLNNIEATLICVIILGAILFAGCRRGDTGPTGPAGPAGPVVTVPEAPAIGESCKVCHGTGKIVDIAEAHPDSTGMDVTLSNITLTNTAGTLSVTFNAATAAGPVMDLVIDDFRFMIADLVPSKTPTTNWGSWSSPYFERWAYERSSDTYGDLDVTDATNGNYTYTFVTTFADAPAQAPDYNETHTQRLAIFISGHDDAYGSAVTNNTVGFLDFVTPAGGGAVTTSVSQRMFVTADACKKCHGAPFQQAAHADRYLDTRACVICHTPIGTAYGSTMQDDNAYLSIFIHKIHSAMEITKNSTGEYLFEDAVRGLGYEGVTYPRDIKECVACHSNPDNLLLGSGDMIDNWKSNPTAEICSSCHVDVNPANGANHEGGIQFNGSCIYCHPATGPGLGMSVADAHDTPPAEMNVPEYKVHLDITPPANGSYYTAGEDPEVRVTLTNYATDAAVASTIYTTAQDDAGNSGGGLRVASLYMYGPRADSVPVLATGTTTDSNFDISTDTPAQAHDLFTGGSDPLVTTDSTGFGYQLLPIPDNMTAGTYMVRVRIGDYSRVNDNDYKIESLAFTTIQIGTATTSEKVAGDACVDCHGTGTASFHDARHAVVFDTDECLSCHDQSGNHAIPIANRVHAVHSTNSDGDIYNIEGGSRDWSYVTFPQNIQSILTGQAEDDGLPRCVACHTSDAVTYKTRPYMMPCVGCHANAEYSDIDHMRQNGGPF